ncbi:Chromosome transmission fidelity protein 18 [Recurvomyces mirabilis]|uniref:Chromosome transmission fidelity protein 18 n=1 Tax=Recurvomyces mirabilis TaxID=574656 RepID=A0AAE0TN86_9PEZI|nr:Chromosome transmission fidelity protein 18 [Recurvomyces mirabilis]KAK5156354.1 Chromosome transmission fidelity protein 18 [Recurvomyces mirabilis]
MDSGIPDLCDLEELLSDLVKPSIASTQPTTFSEDVAAFADAEEETLQARTSGVLGRSWRTCDIFRSEPVEPGTSSPLQMLCMASSPPLTPSLARKRKFTELNLGENQLARPAKAQRSYYGINIHQLLEDAQAEAIIPIEAYELPTPPAEQTTTKKSSLLWTEKYRARKFTDLIGDERTHRSVMYWLKRWDQIVFPGSYRPQKPKKGQTEQIEERPLKKILMLTGPPGLGKTTLAHVCAKQAGYEVQEINASDERSSNVVRGRIRDMVGTENVKGVDTRTVDGKVRKAGKPVCVIVDEVDGVVSGSGGAGGEGGFVKALIDLILLDQKNSSGLSNMQQAPARKKKGDRFRLQRPLILICNDIYHPSLRPLRQSSHAEVIHMRKPQIQTITARMQSIFDKEGVPCEGDGVRRLCEATWGVSNRKEDRGGNGAGEGDMRGIMVVGEWIAGKLRAEQSATGNARLTRRWVEDNVLRDLSHGGGATRGLGGGGPKDIVERVFQEGAGFPKSSAPVTPSNNSGARGVAEGQKRTATDRLRELVDTHGDTDRIMTDCFTTYPDHPFQDDTLLSKPSAAYDWLHFHDRLSSAVFTSNEWELAPYLSTPVLAFHHLFASPTRAQYQAQAQQGQNNTDPSDDALPPHPFTGPQASWTAHETTKHHLSLLETLHSSLTLDLTRSFSSTTTLSTDLLPYLLRMLSPNVNPVIVGGSATDREGKAGTASVRKASEQQLLSRSVEAMLACGIHFERTRVTDLDSADGGKPSWQAPSQWIYRMEPSIDVLGTYSTGGKDFGDSAVGGKQRFAVRQVLDQEWKKAERKRAEAARMARFKGGAVAGEEDDAEAAISLSASAAIDSEAARIAKMAVKRDFFGRVIVAPVPSPASAGGDQGKGKATTTTEEGPEGRIWVTFHEGFSNAVRKPIGLGELMKGL